MHEKETKEQILQELLEMQKAIEERVEEQEELIRKFQLLTQHEGLFSQVIENFPYPIAIYEHSGTLTMANQAMLRLTCIKISEIAERKINLFSGTADAGADLLKAANAVFTGETTLLQGINVPLLVLAGKKSLQSQIENYQKAVFFPVFINDGKVMHGVVMLMK